jgi:hypothetical protein
MSHIVTRTQGATLQSFSSDSHMFSNYKAYLQTYSSRLFIVTIILWPDWRGARLWDMLSNAVIYCYKLGPRIFMVEAARLFPPSVHDYFLFSEYYWQAELIPKSVWSGILLVKSWFLDTPLSFFPTTIIPDTVDS